MAAPMPLPNASTPLPRKDRAVLWGLLFCGYCALVLLAQLVHQSAIKPLWRDELFSLYEVQGKTWGEVLQSLKGGVNLLPPAYFFVLWSSLHFTDFTPLLGRALSSVFIAATVPVMWLTLRRTVGTLITTVAISVVLFCSPLIFYHNSEARPYGLLLFAAGLVAWGFARSTDDGERVPRSTVGLIIIANAFLPSVNYMGGFYSAAALAVTLGIDLTAGRRRWSVYGGYVAGWALFAVWGLPLCVVQYRTRGAEAAHWQPEFPEALAILAKQWAKTLLPLAPVAVLFGVWLFLGRKKSSETTRSPEPQGALPLAVLGLAWLLIPLVFIGQSLVTHRNLFVDRYFIASDLGWILLAAAIASGACRRWRGSPTLEAGLPGLTMRRIGIGLVLAIVAIVSIRFYKNPRNVLWGNGDAINACKAWPGPKATFSLSCFIEGYVRSGPNMQFIILSRGPSDRETIRAYCRDFQISEIDGLAVYPEFVYVDSSEAPADLNLERWAASHGYTFERVGFYAESHGKKAIFQMRRSTPVMTPTGGAPSKT